MMEIKRRITKAYFDMARKQYSPLINILATNIGHNKTQMAEMVVVADDELLKCMICYNGDSSFITFLYSRLSGAFKHIKAAAVKHRRISTVSLDSVTEKEEPSVDMDTNMMAQDCLRCLKEDELSVITQLFFEERTMREISEDEGYAPSTICHIKARAIDKMRKHCLRQEV
jgi:RNA polymerase sigma factor (sigma-70 family)